MAKGAGAFLHALGADVTALCLRPDVGPQSPPCWPGVWRPASPLETSHTPSVHFANGSTLHKPLVGDTYLEKHFP